MSNISIKLNLLQLNAVVKKLKGKSGEIECLVLPLRENNFFVSEKGIYLDLQAFELKQKKEGSKDTHLVKQSLPKEVYEQLSEEGKRAIPIIGNLAIWDSGTAQQTRSSAVSTDETDDLPF